MDTPVAVGDVVQPLPCVQAPKGPDAGCDKPIEVFAEQKLFLQKIRPVQNCGMGILWQRKAVYD
jgi:hypothetical protein